MKDRGKSLGLVAGSLGPEDTEAVRGGYHPRMIDALPDGTE